MKLNAVRVLFKTRYPFRIARSGGSVEGDAVHRIIVRLEHEGTYGYGEAAPSIYYGQTLDSVDATLARISERPDFADADPFHVVPMTHRLVEAFDDQRSAISAIDAALHDWVGRRLGLPVWRLLGLDATATPPTSVTIGIDDPSYIAQKVSEAGPFGTLKVKVGTNRDDETLAIIRDLAPHKRLRLDANTAWTSDSALEHIHRLARFNPEMIEQPIAAGQLEALREIHRASPVPIFADEDCVRPADVQRLAGCVAGINIKLAKCGGIRQALAMITLAHGLGLRVMLGCMVETSLGISAAAQLASLVDAVDLDGHLLLADEPFGALRLDGDRVLPSDLAGLGADASRLF